MPDLSNFHLLRPMWLWALLPAAGIWVMMLLEQSSRWRWRAVIAPHLLEHLVRQPRRGAWTRPVWFALPSFVVIALALSGPAWERQETPFVQDRAPLVVALDLSPSMDSIDVRPSRLERSKQKIRDLLALRPAARTGLIAYAGSSHIVLPLTDDARLIEMYLVSLKTELMPVAGKDAARALDLAEQMLAKERAAGTILFVTDGIGEPYAPAFEEHRRSSRNQVLVLAVGTSQGGPVRSGEGFLTDARGEQVVSSLDRKGLETLEARAGVYVAGVTTDRSDVEKLVRKVNTHLESVQAADERVPWEDYGYYLGFLVLPVSLLWFRKGWTIRWQ
ncbi:MAG: VWA domain-containing protein [bacterium]